MNDRERRSNRLLIIEDNPSDQSVYRRTLQGFDLEFVRSGEEGLQRILQESFDLVVLDFHLARMNGEAVLESIRSELALNLPVVVVSGGGNEQLAVEMIRKGASDFVTKDELHTPRIVLAVLGALERHRLERSRRSTENELRGRKDELESALRKLQEAQAQLIQSEKLASLGQLVAGVAHEINNPLSYASNNLAVLDRDLRQVADLMTLYRSHLGEDIPTVIREFEQTIDIKYTLSNLERLLKSTKQGLHRVGEIVEGLRDFSRLDESEQEWADLNQAVRLTVEMIRYPLRQKEIRLVIESQAIPEVWCNPAQIHQLLLSLLMNAIQAVEPGATVTIRTRPDPEIHQVEIDVADDGPGIPEAIRGKIFDPFFTTKPQGVGTGLGLWMAYQIVRDHGGKIDLITEVGRGTTFTITLPVQQRAATK
ncbi:sensor histidine kinase [Tundrisphaera lichenicola]|uniref:sensor histidine kinase n=1 Tax=Tundrisphaera lichenicola TaxID=2029860 RepID=UPI003EC00209